MGGALVRLGHFPARVKIWGAAPLGAEIWSTKNALSVDLIQHQNLQGY